MLRFRYEGQLWDMMWLPFGWKHLRVICQFLLGRLVEDLIPDEVLLVHYLEVCKSGAQEYCNRTWGGNDTMSPRLGVPAVVWTGAIASSPQTHGTPHNQGPITKTQEESRRNMVKSALDARADQFQMGGQLHGAERRLGPATTPAKGVGGRELTA